MSTKKSDNPLAIPCHLSNCLYFDSEHPDLIGYCYCSHPDKKHYLKGSSCPLYRLDWKKQLQKKKKS